MAASVFTSIVVAVMTVACGSGVESPVSSTSPVRTPPPETTVMSGAAADITPEAPSIPADVFRPSPTSSASEGRIAATVVRVIDGDTIAIDLIGSLHDTVRLVGVDTPEIYNRNRIGEYGSITDTDCLDEWGARASQYVAKMLDGKPIALTVNEPDQRDTYGRLLAYVLLDGVDFNAVLIEQGYGRAHLEYPSLKENEYLELQSQAMSRETGLWGCRSAQPVVTATSTVTPESTVSPVAIDTPSTAPEPTESPLATATPPPTPQPTPSSEPRLTIRCIFYDGLVPRSEADEYVEIINLDDVTGNLKDWVLKDILEGYPTFVFPSFAITPGQRVRVYTSQVHGEWGEFTFRYGRAVWNNTEPDVAVLYSPTGREVSRKSYPPGC